jgi:hypothetical protein
MAVIMLIGKVKLMMVTADYPKHVAGRQCSRFAAARYSIEGFSPAVYAAVAKSASEKANRKSEARDCHFLLAL